MQKIIFFLCLKLFISVADPWHFGMDPDPRLWLMDHYRMRHFLPFLGLKYLNLNSLRRIWDPEWKKIRNRDPVWKKLGSGIRNKHPGSATLHWRTHVYPGSRIRLFVHLNIIINYLPRLFSVLWIRIRSDPELFAVSGINHFGSGSGQSGSGMNLIPNFSVKK